MYIKWIAFLMTAGWISGSLSALPLQNPADPALLEEGVFINSENLCLFINRFPQCIDFQFGYYGDFVWDRKMETPAGDTVHQTKLNTNAGYLALNFFEWVDLFGTVGVTQICVDADQRVLTGLAVTSNMVEIETGSNFSWSAGAHVKLLEACGWYLGLEGQYFQASPHVKFVERNSGDATAPFYLNDATFHYWEWQVGGGLSYEIPIGNDSALVPYIGLKWSRAQLNNNNVLIPTSGSSTAEMVELQEDKKWGYAVGVTLVAFWTGSVTAEVRFLDEKALHINMKLRF